MNVFVITPRILSAIVILSCLLVIAASSQVRHQRNGKIAFTSDRDGNREIYVMNPDGTNQVRLTNNPRVDDSPEWSPDGKRLAFVSQKENGSFAIFTMNSDGSNRTEIAALNNSLFATWDPFSWSPNGKMIAFHDSSVGSAEIDVFVVNAGGGRRRNLTADHTHWDITPTWSPDGSKILFSRYDVYAPSGYGGTMLHTVDINGTNLTRLENGFADGWNEDLADWSPATNKIVYSVNIWDFYISLFIADADGRNRHAFENTGLDHFSPSWSPDGRKIAFSRDDVFDTFSEICVKNIDGSGFTVLTTTAHGKNSNPSWQRLAVNTTGDGDEEE